MGEGPRSPFPSLFNLCVAWLRFLHVKKLETTLSPTLLFSLFSSLKTTMIIHFQIFTDKIFWINDLRLKNQVSVHTGPARYVPCVEMIRCQLVIEKALWTKKKKLFITTCLKADKQATAPARK